MRYIIVLATLAAILLPCGHADEHFGHHHDSEIGHCAVDSGHCACNACEPEPCADKTDVQLIRISEMTAIGQPSTAVAVKVWPVVRKAPRSSAVFLPSGVLASLQTIQLLI